LVDASGAADDGVEEPGVQASGLVTREINHDGDGPIDPDPRRPPDVLINSKGLNAVQPGWVAGPGLGLHLDRIPTGVPVHPEMSSERRDGGVVVAECIGRPTDRTDGQRRPRRRQIVSLAERDDWTHRFLAEPDPHQPAQQRDPAETRRVVQRPDPAAVPDSHHPARRAARLHLTRLDRQHQTLLSIDLDVEHVHLGDIEDRIGPGAPARTRTTHRVVHRRGLP
jgi:hypothetical protein